MVFTLALSLMVVLSASVSAQQHEKGDYEVQFQGFFLKPFEEGSGGSLTAIGLLGYFYTSKSEIIGGTLTSVTFGGGDTQTVFGGFGGYRYHFEPRGKAVPYVGGEFALFRAAESTVSLANGQVGVKYYFQRNLAFDVAGAFGVAFGNGSSAFALSRFGLSVFF
jgi:hypothetical protein